MNTTVITSQILNETETPLRVMSTSEIMKIAPMVYATEKTNPYLSKHYTFASTETVINDMAKLGWQVVNAGQPHPRRCSEGISSFHRVTFQKEGMVIVKKNEAGEIVERCAPEILLTNSHDGFNCFTFRIGLARERFINGISIGVNSLVIRTSSFSDIRLKHIGYSFDDLRALVAQIVEQVPVQIKVINAMGSRNLTVAEQRQLALEALRNRQNKPELVASNIILDEIIEPAEYTETSDSLWEVFNTIQSKLMDGDFHIMGKRGLRKARRINAIWKSINFSQALFKSAADMIG